MINLVPDYSEKTLHIAMVLEGKDDKGRGLVYLPQAVYSKINPFSERMYEEFFMTGREFILLPVATHQGPGEFANTLEKKFGLRNIIHIGGIIASLDVTLKQARAIIKDLRENPQRYHRSPEAEIFGGQKL